MFVDTGGMSLITWCDIEINLTMWKKSSRAHPPRAGSDTADHSETFDISALSWRHTPAQFRWRNKALFYLFEETSLRIDFLKLIDCLFSNPSWKSKNLKTEKMDEIITKGNTFAHHWPLTAAPAIKFPARMRASQ